MATLQQVQRRGRWALLVGTFLIGALVFGIFGAGAFGSSVSSAAFSGGTGTFTSGGVVYAKNGGALTLTLGTSSDTKCVDITGAFTAHQTSTTTKSSWTFNFTAGSGDASRSVTATASPNFNSQGNCTGSSGSNTASFVLDNTGPTVTATLSPPANGTGWNNSNVTINWNASDAGSGVASGPTPSSDSQQANTSSSGVTKSSTAMDNLGNVQSGSVTVRLDKMPPTITGSRSVPANSFGWNNTDVTVSFSCADPNSGIKSCTSPVGLTTSGANQSAS